MTYRDKYKHTLCKTCDYTTTGGLNTTCEICSCNYCDNHYVDNKHIIRCRCCTEATEVTCPYYKEYKDGKDN